MKTKKILFKHTILFAVALCVLLVGLVWQNNASSRDFNFGPGLLVVVGIILLITFAAKYFVIKK